MGPTPYWIELFDLTTGAEMCIAATGTTCSSAAVQAAPTTHTYIAFLAGYGTTLPPPGIQATSNTVAVNWFTCTSYTVVVNQDNSGITYDLTEDHVIPAPVDTTIQVDTVQWSSTVYRGSAHVNTVTKTPSAITINIYTQAADTGLFGHHSGGIDVTVTFNACPIK